MTMRTTLTEVTTGKVGVKYGCLGCGQLADMYKVKEEIWHQAIPLEEERSIKAGAAFELWLHRCPNGLSTEEERTLRRNLRPHIVLCFNCLERRLGRRLTLDDFTEDNINRPILLGYALANPHWWEHEEA